MLTKDQVLTSDKEEVANILNAQFHSVFTSDPATTLPTPSMPSVAHNQGPLINSFDYSIVRKQLSTLNRHKSQGPDGGHPYVLRECADVFSLILSLFFEKSYAECTVPIAWKDANITPIHKKGKRTVAGNYRPISLTSVICKVMERIVRDEMMSHLSRNGLISSEQHGFVRRRSCLTNLLETIDLATEALNRGFLAVLVFLDFAKAFDKLSHRALQLKLELLGFDDHLLKWLADFLKDRRQRVVLGEAMSSWLDVISGVPQGSVLGPLLFIVFINDLPRSVKDCMCRLFADDTKLLAAIRNAADMALVQKDIDTLVKWASDWIMSFNVDKCKYMIVGPSSRAKRQHLGTLTMDSTDEGARRDLVRTKCERDLGILVTDNLSWTAQATSAANKANFVLGQLKRAFKHWTTESCRALYTSLVRPHLEYASSAWNPYRKGDVAIIERIQRRATKLVPNLRTLDYTERLQHLRLTTLELRRTRGDLIEYYKYSNSLTQLNLSAPPLPLNARSYDGPARNTRGGEQRLTKQFTKNTQRDMFFSNRVVNDWNKLPQDIISTKSLNNFKNELDNFLTFSH